MPISKQIAQVMMISKFICSTDKIVWIDIAKKIAGIKDNLTKDTELVFVALNPINNK
jgi:hypothetical protein